MSRRDLARAAPISGARKSPNSIWPLRGVDGLTWAERKAAHDLPAAGESLSLGQHCHHNVDKR